MDTYRNFAELRQSEEEGRDFHILQRRMDSAVAVMAPHGGGIEPGTIDIAEALAGGNFAFYAFCGSKTSGNGRLHLTSNRFDEPASLQMAEQAAVVVTVHGNRRESEEVFVGGRHTVLKERICRALTAAGFRAKISEQPGLRGMLPENICNRGTSGGGVQLEISRGLRRKMLEHLARRSERRKTRFFYDFVEAIRQVLLAEFGEGNHVTRPEGARRRS